MLRLKLRSLATWCKELTHWKRLWCWERLKAGREGDDRGWDGWMASPTQWTWIWVNCRSSRWTGMPGVLQSMGSQRVGHDWVTETEGDIMSLGMSYLPIAIRSMNLRMFPLSISPGFMSKIISLLISEVEDFIVTVKYNPLCICKHCECLEVSLLWPNSFCCD